MITYIPLTRSARISKFRKMVGESLHPEPILRQVMDLMEDIVNGKVADDALLANIYSAGSLRSVGAWWMDINFVFEITSIYIMNVVIEIADKLKIDKVKEQPEILRAMKVYAPLQRSVAESSVEYLVEQFGEGDYNHDVAAMIEDQRQQYIQGMSPAVRATAERAQLDLQLAFS